MTTRPLVLTAVVGVVAAAALGTAVGRRSVVMATQADATSSSLRPDPALVHYRFPITPDPQAHTEISQAIRMLEASSSKGALELAELADLYARRAQQDGDPADTTRAFEHAQRSLTLLPSPNGAELTLAKLLGARHEFRASIEHVRAYLAHGDSAGAYLVLATDYLALGDLPAACDAAETAVDARPRASSYLMRALVMQAQGRDDEAAYDFGRAAAVEDHGDPAESARMRALWGRFLLRAGEYDAAATVLAESLRIVPGFALALAQQGELALRRGHHREAIALFDQAFATGREARYLIDRARAQHAAGDVAGATTTRAQAEKLIRKAIVETGTGHRLELVELLVDRGAPHDVAEAVQLARAELEVRTSADTRFQLARALARSGAHAAASVEIRRALASGIRDARIYELAARIERAVANPARADLYARKARELDPANTGWRTLGMP